MSHPTVWPGRSFFYPIGNTMPICLTDHLPPEEDATVLLLGCGDPRSILYTIAADHGHNRSMDFTCCDWEPAIIARNALLISLIADNVDAHHLLMCWSIFYDVFIDKKTASLLNEHCTRLVESSADIATWNASSYSRFIRFATQETLDDARRHWSSYVETLALPSSQQKQLRGQFMSAMQEISGKYKGTHLSAAPSAAPLTLEFVLLSMDTYGQYWKTGITNPDTTPSLSQANPTFLFSIAGRQFNLHYGTDLCAAFHLGLALAKVTLENGRLSTPGKTAREMWKACRDQFSRWAIALHRRISQTSETKSRTMIRFACSEALAFCDGLKLCKAGNFTPSIYSSMWGCAKLSFRDRTIPTAFNVIDTSNLSDHIGLLNVLTAVVPLLQKTPFTVLNTSTMISYQDHPTKRSAIEERALLDFPSLALLLGVTPICFSSGLTFRNSSEDSGLSAFADYSRHIERVSWKWIEYTHAQWRGEPTQRNHEIQYKPSDLADKLFNLYLTMFGDENPCSVLGRLKTGDFGQLHMQNTHYHRQSFVRFLHTVRSLGFINTNWPQAFDLLVGRVTTDTQLLLGANNFQNLFTELHVFGVSSESPFLPNFVHKRYGPRPAPYEKWEVVPPVVCVVLKVPRAALKVLEDMSLDEVGHPLLTCDTFRNQIQNNHDSIRPVFGDIINREGRKVIVEDPEGIRGKSPLIVSFFIGSWVLADQGRALEIGLCIKTTLASAATFRSKLGSTMRLYSARLSNQENVFILPERPDNPGELQCRASMALTPPQPQSAYGVTNITRTNTGDEILTRKLDIVTAAVKDTLADKATKVDIKQTTPHQMQVTIGQHNDLFLSYPIPIDGSRSKTRIARKSAYVDVAPRVSPLSQLMLQPFPMTRAAKGLQPQLACYNAPYVDLDRLVALAPLENAKWIRTHLGLSSSRRERELQESKSGSPEVWGPSLNFKVSLGQILLRHAQEGHKIYVLEARERSSPHAIIFLSHIRLDTASATILGDAAVVFPDITNVQAVARCLGSGSAVRTVVYGDELRWWSHAFPVFAERCRQWEHLSTCEYQQAQLIPLSVQYEQSPICSCGKGKNLASFLENPQWKGLTPHATRIALAPIFPVPYLEDVTIGTPSKRQSSSLPPPNVQSQSSSADSRSALSGGATCYRCQGAGKPKLFRCSVCSFVQYCSKECQVADWKEHKIVCKMLKKVKD